MRKNFLRRMDKEIIDCKKSESEMICICTCKEECVLDSCKYCQRDIELLLELLLELLQCEEEEEEVVVSDWIS